MVQMDKNLFTSPPADGCLSCLQVLTTTNKEVSMNIHVQVIDRQIDMCVCVYDKTLKERNKETLKETGISSPVCKAGVGMEEQIMIWKQHRGSFCQVSIS